MQGFVFLRGHEYEFSYDLDIEPADPDVGFLWERVTFVEVEVETIDGDYASEYPRAVRDEVNDEITEYVNKNAEYFAGKFDCD